MNPKIFHKTLPAAESIKSIDDESGWFEGFASTYSVDTAGDQILPGAFKRTLDHKGGQALPIFLNHDASAICGFNHEAKEVPGKGLWVKGKLHLDTECGRMAYHLLKGSVASQGRAGLSIGFRVPKDGQKQNKSGGYDISQLSLIEYSVTPFPCQSEALVSSIKSTLPSITVDQAVKAIHGDDSELAPEEKENIDVIKQLIEKISAEKSNNESVNPVGPTEPTQKEKPVANETQQKDNTTVTSPMTFDAALTLTNTKDDLNEDRWNMERALCDVVESIKGSDMDLAAKKVAIYKAYSAYAQAMAEWQGRMIDAELTALVATKSIKGMGTAEHAVMQAKLAQAGVHLSESKAAALKANKHQEKAHGLQQQVMSAYMSNNVLATDLGKKENAEPNQTKSQPLPIETKSQETPEFDMSALLSALAIS
jgi:HK97 family phage prohead protease